MWGVFRKLKNDFLQDVWLGRVNYKDYGTSCICDTFIKSSILFYLSIELSLRWVNRSENWVDSLAKNRKLYERNSSKLSSSISYAIISLSIQLYNFLFVTKKSVDVLDAVGRRTYIYMYAFLKTSYSFKGRHKSRLTI